MDWLHSYASLRDHPKTKKLARLLGVSVPSAIGHLHCLWWWSMDYAPDGDLTDVEPDVIADGAGWDGDPDVFLDALVNATKEKGGSGFLDNGSRLLIHDHEEYIGRYLTKAAKEAARKRRERAEKAADEGRTSSSRPADAGRTSAARPTDAARTSDGRPTDGARTASRDAHALTEETEKTEETEEKPPLPPQPVDNSASQERGGSIDQDQSEEPPAIAADDSGSCDGAKCHVRCFPSTAFGPLRRAMLASLKPEQFKEVGTGGDLDQLLEEYARHICAACQADLGEFDRPQRDELCERALLAGVENLKGASDVKAVMRSRLQRYGLLQLTDDRTVEELRRTKRGKRRKGEPKALSDCLPPAFAQPQGAAKAFDAGESGAA